MIHAGGEKRVFDFDAARSQIRDCLVDPRPGSLLITIGMQDERPAERLSILLIYFSHYYTSYE
jgi:hypothetical protein